MPTERELQVSPIVAESVMHNAKVWELAGHLQRSRSHLSNSLSGKQTLSNLQSLTSALLGVAAGILGLESYSGFLFYIVLSIITSVLFYTFRVAPTSLSSGYQMLDTGRYFRGPFEFWTGGIFSGLAGFILTWTLFYGLVRA